MQQSNWAQGCPTHSSETSPNRTRSNAWGTMRCENCSYHQMRCMPSEPSASKPPPPSTRCPRTPQGQGLCPAHRRCPPWGWQQGRDQPTAHGTVNVVRRGGGGRLGQEWVRKRGTQERQQTGGGATQTHRTREPHQRDKGEHSRQGGGAQQGKRGNQDREPEWRAWDSVRMGGSDNKGDGLASQPRRYRVPGQPLLNRHQVGGSPAAQMGCFAQQEREPTRGRPAMRGKGTYGGRSGQRMEEQGTWASRTRKHREAGIGRPVDRGACTAKTVKQPQQQPAQPQYANYWAPLMHKRHTMPHPAQPRHTNHWAPRTRNDTSKSTSRSGRQTAATRRNMPREERVTVQGPVKKQQPGGTTQCTRCCWATQRWLEGPGYTPRGKCDVLQCFPSFLRKACPVEFEGLAFWAYIGAVLTQCSCRVSPGNPLLAH